MINAEVVKGKIISILERRGPSLPIQIGKELNMNSIFTSAFLSELLDDKKIKVSTLRVGGSSLYLLLGQEPQLEKFYNFLHPKEAEAYELLKKNKILKDSEQEPAIRVALRAIRDFAFSFKNDEQIYWRFLGVSEGEVREILAGKGSSMNSDSPREEAPKIEDNSVPAPEKPALEVSVPDLKTVEVSEKKFDHLVVELTRPEVKTEEKTPEEKPGLAGDTIPEEKSEEIKPKKKQVLGALKTQKKQPIITSEPASFNNPFAVKPEENVVKEKPKSPFVLEVISFIKSCNWRIIEEKECKPRECTFIVQIDTELGPMDFLTLAKDKKSINDKELDSLLRESQTIPLPALLLYPGSITKNGQAYLEKYYSILKAKRL